MKTIQLKIEHLPINKWFHSLTSDETKTKLDTVFTNFIQLNKDQGWNKKDDNYHIYVSYRDFLGVLDGDNLTDKRLDTIQRLNPNFTKRLKEDSVIEVYWSFNQGMVGYKKNNGEVYNLVDE